MTRTQIVGGELHTSAGLQAGNLNVVDGIIQSVGDGYVPSPGVEIDATGLIVSPGFIDLQINGGFGLDLLSDPEMVWELGRRLPEHGVSAFLPTIISSPSAATNAMLSSLRRRPDRYLGAEPIGAHFEGPMLSPQRPGTHPVEHLAAPRPDLIAGWSRDDGVVMATIAPELPGATEIIEELVRRNVTVAAGHSNATRDEARVGIEAGVSMVTHLFNAMAPFGHRSPNLVGVTLAERELTAGLIVDGVHVDPVVVAAAWNAKGPRGIALVTDAVAAMDEPPGHYQLSDRTIVSDGSSVRDSDGNLAGSVLTMDSAVRNLVAYTNCEPHEALTSASGTPARVIGQSRIGCLAADKMADLVLLDQKLEVQVTLCSGRLAYIAETATARIPDQLMEDH